MITTTWIGTKVCPACNDPMQLDPGDKPPHVMEEIRQVWGSWKPGGLERYGPYPLHVVYTRVVLPDGRLCCDAKCAAKTLELDGLPPESRKAAQDEWRATYRLHGLGEYASETSLSIGAWIKGPAREVKTREVA